MSMDIVELQNIFEYELKRKLAQRSRSTQEELRRLISAFKFFDYTSSHILDKNLWIKGVLRTGLCGFNINDLAKVFDRYDPNKTGYVNYINFSNHVYGNEELMPISPNFQIENLINGNITPLNKKGKKTEFIPPGLYERDLSEKIKQEQMSHYNNSESALNDFNLNNNNNSNYNNNANNSNYHNNSINDSKQKNYHMTKSQSQIIQNKSPTMNIENRLNDSTNNNIQLNSKLNNNVDINVNNELQNNQTSQINQMTQMNRNTSSQENKNYFQKLINIFQSKINVNNGIIYYTFARELKLIEDKNTKTTSIENLLSVIQKLELNISQDDLINFYSILDYTQSNQVPTDEILRLIKGEISEQRKMLVVSKFILIDKEKTGYLPISLLKQLYNYKFHPDAFLQKKSEEQVYEEFLYTFDVFCELNGLKDEISFKDFIEYYTPISASILNDNYFDDIIYGVWNLEGTNYHSSPSSTNNTDLNKINDNQIKNENKFKENELLMNKNVSNNYQMNQASQGNQMIDVSKSQNIARQPQMEAFSSNINENRKKVAMTPYYNPRASPEGKGLKMFRQLQFNPITNEFNMFPIENNGKNPNINNNYGGMNDNQNNALANNSKINLLRELLAKRGQKSIFIIQRMLYIYDRNRTGEIPFDKLCDIFEIYNINITKEEIFEFFSILDKEKKGIIKYNDLIQLLINNINKNREFAIHKLFESLNKGNGYVLINDIKQNFNPEKHPDVFNQIKSKDEVALDFFDSIEIFREYNTNLNNENVSNGILTYEDFCNFFKEISMSIGEDFFFEYLLNNCWSKSNYSNNSNYGYGNDNVRIRAGQQIISNQ